MPVLINRKTVLATCAAGLVGAGVGSHLTGDRSTPTPDRAHTQHGVSREVRVGQAPVTAETATEVALRYVLNGQALLDAGPAGVDAVLAPIVAPTARKRLVGENERNVVRVTAELSAATGPIPWRQAPLAVRVTTTGDVAMVAVWHVGVLSAPGVAPPQAHWSTSSVELENTGGAWKVTDEAVVEGPMPLNGGNAAPADDTTLEAALDGFAAPPQS